jgi:hypothetical protein
MVGFRFVYICLWNRYKVGSLFCSEPFQDRRRYGFEITPFHPHREVEDVATLFAVPTGDAEFGFARPNIPFKVHGQGIAGVLRGVRWQRTRKVDLSFMLKADAVTTEDIGHRRHGFHFLEINSLSRELLPLNC